MLTSGYPKETVTVKVGVTVAEDENYKALEEKTVAVTIKTILVTGVTLNPTTATVTEEENFELEAVVSPADATDMYLIWETSDNGVVEVDGAGIVYAKREGTATITVTATNETEDTSDDHSATCTVTVTAAKKPDSEVTKAPTANTLIYSGEAQAFVTEGTAAGCTMQYVLGRDAKTAPGDGWSASIPTGINAGAYYVWYRVKGDENHTDTIPGCIQVTISEPETFTITFDSAGGSEVPEQKAEKGKTVVRPSDPVRSGYTFIEWMLNDKPYDWTSPVTGNLKLLAQWKEESAETFTVTFDAAGGTGSMDSLQITKRDKFTFPAPAFLPPANHVFAHWRIGENKYSVNDIITVNADFNVIAVWTEKTGEWRSLGPSDKRELPGRQADR